MIDIRNLVDVENATQSRLIFGDPEIYQLELERIFARCWLFLTHESLVPAAGDFVVTKMGEDEVIVWRQRDGGIKVFLNVCTHRGMRLCQAESGNAKGLSCNYHGWAFAVDGALSAVPAEEAIYGAGLDKCKLGLRAVPRVEIRNGFIFGCMDAGAPSLAEYLGDAAWYFDIWSDVPGGVELLGPPARSIMTCNWKSPTENFIGDSYHVGWTHAPVLAAMSGGAPPPQAAFVGDETSFQMTSRYGHGLGIFNDFGPAVLLHECPELVPWME
ncbi:MAG TPA: Rieske 2Fe-2S domain-containing protein, partial [Novosphingobium sp.]|nr:Rieske 2Fe-2S domain-containing protein [Novosphingobium sp.]